jgi:hypothetical protein
MGCMWASCWPLGAERSLSLSMSLTHVDTILRGLSAAADGAEGASSSVGMPSHATAFFTRAKGHKRPLTSSRGACGALVASTCRVFNVGWEFLVLSCALYAKCVCAHCSAALCRASDSVTLLPPPLFYVHVFMAFLVITNYNITCS